MATRLLLGENGIKIIWRAKTENIYSSCYFEKILQLFFLDEATSSLDAESEEIVQNAITEFNQKQDNAGYSSQTCQPYIVRIK